jgi:hypothetical protein
MWVVNRYAGSTTNNLFIRAWTDAMQDVKELIGIIMRVLDHAEIDEADVLDLELEAEGELRTALNDAYIKLLEFVHDRDLRRANHDLEIKERAVLQDSLNKIVQLCDVDRN